ncbi:hypothetical protein FOZ63_028966 [Perkinsus olseni]|uniref:Uncharacterized protein n=1 Tax=Perkinsus olseni TaxID=32597 RepID=A0A7J6Q1C6_PEROL|nr:hypothetical protein FOZ63_028966 [Perkinsus olseni]
MTVLNGLSDIAGFVLAHHYSSIVQWQSLISPHGLLGLQISTERILRASREVVIGEGGPVLILTVSAASSGLFVCGPCPTDLNPTHARITVLKLAGSRLTSRGPASYLNQSSAFGI